MSNDRPQFESQYFRVEKLTEGVWAGIAHYEAGNIANVGIVDLGLSVLVVDSFELVQAAQALCKAVDHLIGKPVSVVVNTHAHDDHFIGNGLFPAEACIVSTQHNRDRIVEYAQELPQEKEELVEMLADLRQQHADAPDDQARQRLSLMLTRFGLFLEAFDEMALRPPDLIFEGRLVFYGSQRRVELLSCGVGHTPSDVIAYLPDDRIVFAGDLVTVQVHPFLLHSDPDGWRASLAQMESLDFDTLVPGHGPVGTKVDIASIGYYLDSMEQQVRQVIAQGGTADDAVALPIPAAFEGWAAGAYPRNMRFLFDRLSGG